MANIISLNSNLWYTSNKVVSGTGDPGNQFAWLRDVLTKSREDNIKVRSTKAINEGLRRNA